MDVWEMIDDERRQLAEKLAALGEEDWSRDTLAAGWTVTDVVGHLVALCRMSAGKFVSGMARNSFKFDKLQTEGIRVQSDAKSSAEMLAAFRAVAGARGKPPGPKMTVLGEVMVHGEDINRAVNGSFASHAEEAVVAVADFYKANRFPLAVKKRISGVTLRMTDGDWSCGSGPEVSGPGIAIVMAMGGRKAALSNLHGEGVAVLAARP